MEIGDLEPKEVHNHIETWVSSFYILEELQISVQSATSKFRAIDKLKMDIQEAREKYIVDFSNILFDALFEMVMGEAGHFNYYCREIKNALPFSRHCSSREAIFKMAQEYSPEKVLPELLKIFPLLWSKGFGGKSWEHIVEAILERKTMPSVVWIDHVIDLSHNNGLAFNKPDCRLHMFYGDSYEEILDVKKMGELSKAKLDLRLFDFVTSLIQRGENMGCFSPPKNVVEVEYVPYKPIKYGNKGLWDGIKSDEERREDGAFLSEESERLP